VKIDPAKLADIKGSVGAKIKKWESRIVVGGDIKPHYADKKDGDEWTDSNGKQWIKKNGIAQSISKTAQFRVPLWCPKCQKTMSHKFDTKCYNMHGFCYNCTMAWHTKMRLDGTYDAWERAYMRREEKAYLIDMIKEREEYIRTFRTPQAHYSDGRWDELAPMKTFEPALQQVRQDIEDCKTRIQMIENEEANEATLQESTNDQPNTTNTANITG
jgi:hypothetical protein